eukprot:CAMPEP_0168478370 /NCGR_PEP_ID=MMETSP0228-20121227/62913_1 /TAXON_ID=133427 /ORGANISM="Protoceratium reticulatum, Strain CCCM 535 (=CCMP 1889)" /LENGTH=167 /DNA_ID=CAMNT_0008494609 /DNA_START=70 /DNA_END=569 /DNA_ORIENTATION=+
MAGHACCPAHPAPELVRLRQRRRHGEGAEGMPPLPADVLPPGRDGEGLRAGRGAGLPAREEGERGERLAVLLPAALQALREGRAGGGLRRRLQGVRGAADRRVAAGRGPGGAAEGPRLAPRGRRGAVPEAGRAGAAVGLRPRGQPGGRAVPGEERSLLRDAGVAAGG